MPDTNDGTFPLASDVTSQQNDETSQDSVMWPFPAFETTFDLVWFDSLLWIRFCRWRV